MSKPSTRADARKVELPDFVPQDVWDAWIEARRQARWPVTARAAQLMINKLSALANEGHDPRAVLEQSIINGWRGLFPLPDRRRGGSTSRSNDIDVAAHELGFR